MSYQKAMVKSYVRRRLEQWQRESNEHMLRADMANLRRSIGKKPGELPELWGLLFRDFPEELMSVPGGADVPAGCRSGFVWPNCSSQGI